VRAFPIEINAKKKITNVTKIVQRIIFILGVMLIFSMNSKYFLIIVVTLLIGFVIGFYFPNLFQVNSKNTVANKVKTLYELANPGTEISVESISDVSGIYKILLKAVGPTGVNYREVYVTKDGKLLTEGVIYVENSTKSIKSFKDFVDCLYDKGVRIYGVLNRTELPTGAVATYLQLNLLGRYSGKLFVDCDGAGISNCLNANVTRVPSVVYDGRVYPGVKSTSYLENITGCKLSQ